MTWFWAMNVGLTHVRGEFGDGVVAPPRNPIDDHVLLVDFHLAQLGNLAAAEVVVGTVHELVQVAQWVEVKRVAHLHNAYEFLFATIREIWPRAQIQDFSTSLLKVQIFLQ
jgi:hypothetical protein